MRIRDALATRMPRAVALAVPLFALCAAVLYGCSSASIKAGPDGSAGRSPSDGGSAGATAGTGGSAAGTVGATGGTGGATAGTGGATAGTGGSTTDASDAITDTGGETTDAGGETIDAASEVGDGGLALLVFNTGVDGSGVPLAGGSVDPHYTLIKSADATLMGPDAIVTSQIAEGFWVPQSDVSKWIAPSANQSYPGASPCNAAGTYAYRTTFDLTGYDPATLKIDGKWAADNSGTDIRLNGVSLGLTAGGYSPLTPFTIQGGFVAGKNTLEFEILDGGCPNGLRVELVASFVTDGST
jgi:hypothetical protein